MTQIYITIGIIAVIASLVCYIFIRQTIGERQQEKDRLLRALVKRAKDLSQMISVFPDDFLPKELVVFIYRCIIDAYEQLTKLNSGEQQYIDALKINTAKLEETVRKPENKKANDPQSINQINELKQYLNLLGEFLQKSLQRNHITPKQHAHYRLLLKELIVKLAVQNYILSAKQCADAGKHRLAIHYYELSKNLLKKETPNNYKDKIAQVETLIEPLMDMQNEEQADSTVAAPQADGDNEQDDWGEFDQGDDWKKKNVYD